MQLAAQQSLSKHVDSIPSTSKWFTHFRHFLEHRESNSSICDLKTRWIYSKFARKRLFLWQWKEFVFNPTNDFHWAPSRAYRQLMMVCALNINQDDFNQRCHNQYMLLIKTSPLARHGVQTAIIFVGELGDKHFHEQKTLSEPPLVKVTLTANQVSTHPTSIRHRTCWQILHQVTCWSDPIAELIICILIRYFNNSLAVVTPHATVVIVDVLYLILYLRYRASLDVSSSYRLVMRNNDSLSRCYSVSGNFFLWLQQRTDKKPD